jgi:uncharacterized protein YjbJ (UPF0337 family)
MEETRELPYVLLRDLERECFLKEPWASCISGAHSNGQMEEFMNWDEVEGKWKQFRGAVKEKWGKLTDDDLDVIAGKREKLAGRIQELYGITRDEADKQIENWDREEAA